MIKHLNNISIVEFIKWVKKIITNTDIIQSVKIDGIQNISFSIIDEKIYQQRISKNQTDLKSDYSEWDKTPIYNNIRSQHKFMQEIYEKNKKIFNKYFRPENNYSFECEIVPPLRGNILYYGNKYGMVIMIRPLGGDVTLKGKNYITVKLKESLFRDFLKEILIDNTVFTFDVTQYELAEKDSIVKRQEKDKKESWVLEKIDFLDDPSKYINNDSKNEIEKILQELEQFLDSKPFKNMDEIQKILYYTNLTNIEVKDREKYKKHREIVQNTVHEKMDSIKMILLKNINKNVEEQRYNFKDIEGIVFRSLNENRDDVIKLIDEKYFTKLNEFFWEIVEHQRDINNDFKKTVQDLVLPQNTKKSFDSFIQDIKESNTKDKIINFVSNIIDQQKIEFIINEINKLQKETKAKIEALKLNFIDDYKHGKLKITVKKYNDIEKEIEFTPELFERFSISILNEKKYYQDIILILDKTEEDTIKLSTALIFIFE